MKEACGNYNCGGSMLRTNDAPWAIMSHVDSLALTSKRVGAPDGGWSIYGCINDSPPGHLVYNVVVSIYSSLLTEPSHHLNSLPQ